MVPTLEADPAVIGGGGAGLVEAFGDACEPDTRGGELEDPLNDRRFVRVDFTSNAGGIALIAVPKTPAPSYQTRPRLANVGLVCGRCDGAADSAANSPCKNPMTFDAREPYSKRVPSE